VIMKEYMNEITSMEEFEKAYHEKGVQVFTFSADWCPDCQFIKGFMPDLVKAYPDYHFYYVDRDQCMEIAQDQMIMGIPSFVGVKDGVETGRFVSKLRKTKDEIDAFLKALDK
jgi:thiol-disulfide isomerase/thioredoxin